MNHSQMNGICGDWHVDLLGLDEDDGFIFLFVHVKTFFVVPGFFKSELTESIVSGCVAEITSSQVDNVLFKNIDKSLQAVLRNQIVIFDQHYDELLDVEESWMCVNRMPLKSLGYKSPYEGFTSLFGSGHN
jgi:hypothetical protein